MKIKRLPFLIIGIILLLTFLTMAIFPQFFTSYNQKYSFEPWLPPSFSHILGTNSLGYDIFAELIYGARQTILISLTASLGSLIIGVIIGILASFDSIIGTFFNGIINIFVLLPKLLILIVFVSFLNNNNLTLIILISCFTWVSTARSIKAKLINLKKQQFIEVNRHYGFSKIHNICIHILPNLKDIIMTRLLLGITTCIMMESTLSFLGFGNLYYPTWGVMINFARNRGALVHQAYGYLIAPCLCIAFLSLSFYFISIYFEGKQTIIDKD